MTKQELFILEQQTMHWGEINNIADIMKEDYCGSSLANAVVVYNYGYMHGVRAERKRKKGKNIQNQWTAKYDK